MPNERKVEWIFRDMEERSSVSGIAKTRNVSRRWVNQLFRPCVETGEIPALRKPGRPASPTSEYVVYLVLRYHEMYGIGRRGIEVAMGRDGVQVPRNRMYAVLKLRGLVKDEPRVAVRTAGLLARMR